MNYNIINNKFNNMKNDKININEWLSDNYRIKKNNEIFNKINNENECSNSNNYCYYSNYYNYNYNYNNNNVQSNLTPNVRTSTGISTPY